MSAQELMSRALNGQHWGTMTSVQIEPFMRFAALVDHLSEKIDDHDQRITMEATFTKTMGAMVTSQAQSIDDLEKRIHQVEKHPALSVPPLPPIFNALAPEDCDILRGAIIEALTWIEINAAGKAREVLQQALNKTRPKRTS